MVRGDRIQKYAVVLYIVMASSSCFPHAEPAPARCKPGSKLSQTATGGVLLLHR